jgi:hypothetical protein
MISLAAPVFVPLHEVNLMGAPPGTLGLGQFTIVQLAAQRKSAAKGAQRGTALTGFSTVPSARSVDTN